MLRKKVFKILSVLVAVVIAFSLLIFDVSASLVSNGASIDVSQYSYLRINGTNSSYYPSINDQGDQFVLRYQIDQSLTSSIDTVTYYDFNSSHNYGTIEILTMSGFGNVHDSQSWNGLYDTTTGEKLNDGNIISSGFKISYTGYIPSRFEIRCYFTSNVDDLLQVIIINSFSFVPLDDPNAPDIDDSINNQDQNTDKIINNQNQNADKIINNQNQNADRITQNQDSNTNKIINGGSDAPHYNSTDKSSIVSYEDAEDVINKATDQSRSASVSLFNNFGNYFSNANFSKGLLAVSKLMTDVFSIDWIATVVQFGLCIGAFAFVLGMVSSVGKFSSDNVRSGKKNSNRKGK